jgi:hypothetical protein
MITMFKVLCILVLCCSCMRSSAPTVEHAERPAFAPPDGGSSVVDAGRWVSPSLQRLLTPRLDKIMTTSLADHSRLQTLQALLLYTERLDAPTVVIGPGPRKYDEAPMLRVKVKYPGGRWVTVDHYDLSLALQQALRLGLGMSRNPEVQP